MLNIDVVSNKYRLLLIIFRILGFEKILLEYILKEVIFCVFEKISDFMMSKRIELSDNNIMKNLFVK